MKAADTNYTPLLFCLTGVFSSGSLINRLLLAGFIIVASIIASIIASETVAADAIEVDEASINGAGALKFG